MSDTTQTETAQTPAVAAAQQALAVKEVSDRVDGLKKQVRALWITVAVIGVLVLVLAAFSIVGRFLGFRAMGGFGGGARFQQMNGQQFNGTGTSGGVTTPGQ